MGDSKTFIAKIFIIDITKGFMELDLFLTLQDFSCLEAFKQKHIVMTTIKIPSRNVMNSFINCGLMPRSTFSTFKAAYILEN